MKKGEWKSHNQESGMNKAIKYRIYPTEKQKEQLIKTFGCCRFVKNYYLTREQDYYKNNDGYLSRTANNNHCNRYLKKQYPWLCEVDKFALTNAIYQLDTAFKRFFHKESSYPKYRSRKDKQSYTTNFTNGNIEVLDKAVKLPKLGKVKAKIHRKAKDGYVLKTATVSMERDGSFYCSILYEYETVITPSEVKSVIGLDYKSDGLYCDSNGNVADMPHYYRMQEKKIRKQQKLLARKIGSLKGEEKSSNYRKQLKKLNKTYRHMANQRKDYLHKLSNEITNRYELICVESLNMRSMSNKGFGNGKATMDNGYGMFLDFVAYKQADKGHYLVRVDKFYASTQLCSVCGHQMKMSLTERTYNCPVCKNHMDRDENAAVNIRNEGYRIFMQVA